MIPSFATAGVLTAPSAPLILSGYVPGNTLAAQHMNWYLGHLTLELNNLLTLGGVVQNAAVDSQVGTAVQNVAQKAVGVMNCVRITSGSAMTIPLGSGTIITALGSGSTYTLTLPSAASALAVGFEVDVQNHNAGATNMLGAGSGSVLVNLLNPNDGLAGVTGGTWQITEQYGHLRVRPALSGNPSGYGWVVESCEGSVYRSVVTSTQTQASPSAGTWYNKGGSVALGPGSYDLSWSAVLYVAGSAGNVQGTLSIANNSESDPDLSSGNGADASSNIIGSSFRRKRVQVLAALTYFLNIKTISAGMTSIILNAGSGWGNIVIDARRIG